MPPSIVHNNPTNNMTLTPPSSPESSIRTQATKTLLHQKSSSMRPPKPTYPRSNSSSMSPSGGGGGNRPRTLTWSPTTKDEQEQPPPSPLSDSSSRRGRGGRHRSNHHHHRRTHSQGGGNSSPISGEDSKRDFNHLIQAMQISLEEAIQKYGVVKSDGTRMHNVTSDILKDYSLEDDCEFDAHVAPFFLQLGNLYFRLNDFPKALEHYKRAIQCQSGPHLGDAYANLGTVFWTTGQVDHAIAMLHQALATYESQKAQQQQQEKEDDPAVDSSESSGDSIASAPIPSGSTCSSNTTKSVANVYHQLGLAYCLKREYGTSMECLQMALQLREDAAAAKQTNSNSVESSSKSSHTKSKQQSDRRDLEALAAIAKTYDAMGKVLACQGLLDAARYHHEKSLSIWRQCYHRHGAPSEMGSGGNSSGMIQTLKNLVAIHTHQHDWAAAVPLLHEVLHEQHQQYQSLFIHHHRNRGGKKTRQPQHVDVSELTTAVHETYSTLAMSYEQLGQVEVAKQCRRRAGGVAVSP